MDKKQCYCKQCKHVRLALTIIKHDNFPMYKLIKIYRLLHPLAQLIIDRYMDGEYSK